jgi:hypothetical protein
MSLRVAYRRVLGLIAYGLFKIPSKSAVWSEVVANGRGEGRHTCTSRKTCFCLAVIGKSLVLLIGKYLLVIFLVLLNHPSFDW